MQSGSWLLAALSLASLSASAFAAKLPAAVVAVPSGKWQVDFGNERCLALRPFEVGADTAMLLLEPSVKSEAVRVMVRVPLKGLPIFDQVEGTLELDGAQIGSKYISLVPLKGGALLARASLPREDGDKLYSAREVAFRTERVNVAMPLSGIAGVRDVLTKCNRSLLESWGFGAEQQSLMTVESKSIRSLPGLFSTNDYPIDAVRKKQSGEVSVRLRILPTGRVGECKVRDSSGVESLDRATCEIIVRRARYEPARNKDGNPVESLDVSIIRWVIPS